MRIETLYVIKHFDLYACFEREGSVLNLTPSFKHAELFHQETEAQEVIDDEESWQVTRLNIPSDFRKNLKIVKVELKELE